MQYYRHTDFLLALVHLALWDDRSTFDELKPISAEEWNIAFQLAAQHAILGIAWQGLSKLNADELPPEDLLCIWTAKATSLEAASARMNDSLADFLEYMQSHDLHPVIMKGQAVAALYPKPLLRETGDIDIFLPSKSEFKTCLSLLDSYMIAPDGSARAKYKDVEIDVHHRLIDICNPLVTGALHSLLSHNPYMEIEYRAGRTLTTTSPEITLTMLSTHIMKHTIGRGIGIRQMCDLAMACARYNKEIDSARMEEISRSLRLRKWDRQVYTFLANQLKMPKKYLPYDVEEIKSRALPDRVLSGGNFGRIIYPPVPGNFVKRKSVTAYALMKNSLWSLRFAPMESIFTFLSLSLGQFRRRK